MGLNQDSGGQTWPQFFRHLVVTNSHYWLICARDNLPRALHEAPQVLAGLNYALVLPEAWQPARELILQLSPFMIRQGHGGMWETFLTRGIARSVEENDPAQIDLRLQLGNLYRLQGRLPEAQRCLLEALALCDQSGQRTHYYTLINYLALVARLSVQHDEALAYCQQVLSEPDLPPSIRAEALNVMGLVGYERRQWAEALSCFEQALRLQRSLNDPYELARLLNNRGLVLLRSGRWDEAEASYREAIQQFQVSGDQTERFKAIMNLGNVFLMRQAYTAAISQYQQALPVFQQCNYLVDLAHTYNSLGMAYTGLADWPVAEAYFQASIEAWRALADLPNLVNVLDNLGEMLIKANRPEQAHAILQQALQLLETTPDSPARRYLQQEIEKRLQRIQMADSVSLEV